MPQSAEHLAALDALGDVDAVAVSGATGAGLDALKQALDRLVAGLPAPDTEAPVRRGLTRRLPDDRRVVTAGSRTAPGAPR